MKIALTATQQEIDGIVIPFVKEKVPQAAGLLEAKLNQPIDLSVKYALEPGKVADLNFILTEETQ